MQPAAERHTTIGIPDIWRIAGAIRRQRHGAVRPPRSGAQQLPLRRMGRNSCAVPGACRSRTECECRLAVDDIAAPAGAAVHPQSGSSLAGVTARSRDRRSGCAGGGVARLVTSDRNVNSQCNSVPAPACPAPPARQRRRDRIKGGRIRYGRGGRRRTAGAGIALVAPGLRVAYPPATNAAGSSVRICSSTTSFRCAGPSGANAASSACSVPGSAAYCPCATRCSRSPGQPRPMSNPGHRSKVSSCRALSYRSRSVPASMPRRPLRDSARNACRRPAATR